MTARAVRAAALSVCLAGIAGMIASGIAGSTGAALTFGLVTATAVLCSIVATAVSGAAPTPRAEEARAEVDALAQRLVEAGADEGDVRDLVRSATQLGAAGRIGRRRSTPPSG